MTSLFSHFPHLFHRAQVEATQGAAKPAVAEASLFQGQDDLLLLGRLNKVMLTCLEKPGGLLHAALYLADRGDKTQAGVHRLCHWRGAEKLPAAIQAGILHVASHQMIDPATKRDTLVVEVADRGMVVMTYRRVTGSKGVHREGFLYLGFSSWPIALKAAAQWVAENQIEPTLFKDGPLPAALRDGGTPMGRRRHHGGAEPTLP